jgi:hypothetical protein
MATIAGNIYESDDKRTALVVWDSITQADTGGAVDISRFPDRTVQVSGTFGGATLTVEGSNDNVTWFTLTNQAGDALSFTAAGLELIAQNPKYIRIGRSGGAGADVNVAINGAYSR